MFIFTKAGWQDLKKSARKNATNYAKLPFLKKLKNQFIAFFVAVSVVSLLFSGVLAHETDSSQGGVVFEILLVLLILPFVHLNHRWAVTAIGGLYLLNRIFLLGLGVGHPITHIAFGYAGLVFTIGAFLEITELNKRQQRGKKTRSVIRRKKTGRG